MNIKIVSLWCAYIILVVTTWWAVSSITNDLDDLGDDVCGAIVLDLTVQTEMIEVLAPGRVADMMVIIDEVREACA